jgi:hypothetical protein
MNQRAILIFIAAGITIVWQLPWGRQLLYPLTLFSTFAHEMGHGVTALLAGAEFDYLLIHADGSGTAVWHGNPGQLATAAIAAGGLLGPSLGGIALLLLARSARLARWLLALVATLLLVATALWSRNAFGIAFLLSTAACLIFAARYLSDSAAMFLLNLVAATLCMSWFTDLDYMFSAEAVVNGVRYPSDSAVIAQTLGLPYWLLGALIATASLAVLVAGIARIWRHPRT